MASLEELLGDLQNELVLKLLNDIKSGEATPSSLNVARQLLKDNHIECIPHRDNAMGQLMVELPSFDMADTHLRH